MKTSLNKGDLVHVPAGTKIYRLVDQGAPTRFEYKVLNTPNYFLVLGTRSYELEKSLAQASAEPKNAYDISHNGQNWFVYQDQCYMASNTGVSA